MPLELPDPPYAAETEETVRARMLASIDPSLSTDEGDIVFDMLTPAAMELAQAYMQMGISLTESFISTASGTYLDALGEQLTGISRDTDETDEHYRARLLARLVAPPGAGNVADYKTWALSVAGVGYVTVEPVWSGAGTVRVLIAAADRTAASGGLQTSVETYIESVMPMGVTLTVATITTTTVAIDCAVTLGPGFSHATVDDDIEARLTDYIATLNPGDDVILSEVIGVIVETEGVIDVDVTTVEIATVNDNLAIAADHLAVLGTVTVS